MKHFKDKFLPILVLTSSLYASIIVLLSPSVIDFFNRRGLVLGEISGTPTALWDGEQPFQFTSGNAISIGCFEGNGCFEGTPDPWHLPTIKLDGLPVFATSINNYDAIRFYTKSNETGKTFDFSVSGAYPNVSNSVNIDPYIEGGQLDTAWRQVVIPTAVLDNNLNVLGGLRSFLFGRATSTMGLTKIYIDSLDVVNLVTPLKPSIQSIDPINFTAGNVGETTTANFTIANSGNAALVINSISLSGTNANDFFIGNWATTTNSGQSQSVPINFKPTIIGSKSATLTINHNKTSIGYATVVALTGQATETGLNVLSGSLDFGSTPVGQNSAKTIAINNSNNQSFNITGISSSNSAFTASPTAVAIPGQGSQNIAVTFTPTAPVNYSGALAINSNDPLHSQITVAFSGNGVVAGEIGNLSLRSTYFTSSRVALAWSPYAGADKTKVYVGSEPPLAAGGDLPIKKKVAELSGTATNYTITNLAASVDAFIRVEALAGETVLAAGNIYLKTPGGPKANLDMPLREVHLVAPNIIELVIANNGVISYDSSTDPYNYSKITGYNGSNWQATPSSWTVKRSDGTAIGVTNVYRHSVSAGQPYYDVGYGVANTVENENKVDVNHHIYLKLNQNVGSRDVLSITGPIVYPSASNFTVVLPYSDKYLETPTIQVNQVGYSPQATRRYAYVSNWLGDGGVLSLISFPANAEVLVDYADQMTPRTSVVGNLLITQRMANDPDSGGEVKEINLASVPPAEGTVYRVRIPGVGVSWPTQVSNSAVFKAFYTNLRGVYFNRWGRNLQPQYADYWSTRPPDHTTAYTSDYPSNNRADVRIPTQPLVNSRPMTGGHHDAGDFDQQVDHYKHSLLLMDIYEYSPNIFTDNQLTIPESGNGIPDILDEALYNLKGWEQLQDYGDSAKGITNYEPSAIRKNDGAVRGGVESYRHPSGYFFADTDRDPYWTYAKDVRWSLVFAGSFAKAARLVAPFNITKANELRERAIAAYNYSVNNYEAIFGVEAATTGGFMFYAAGELYALTGEEKYKDIFESTYAAMSKINYNKGINVFNRIEQGWQTFPGFPNMSPLFFGYMRGHGSNAAYVESLINNGGKTESFTTIADKTALRIDNAYAHRRAKPVEDADVQYPGSSNAWGNGTAGGIYLFPAFDLLKADNLELSATSLLPVNRQKYINAISLAADYLLGANPLGVTFITGLGSRRVEEPVHTDSLTFIKSGKEPIPGLQVFGPTGGLPGNTFYNPAEYVFYPQFNEQPIMRRWGESRRWPALTETPMDLTIMDVMLFAALLPADEVLTPPAPMKPQGGDYRNTLAPRYAVLTAAAADTIKPVTTASPLAGAYTGNQTVYLFANETANIYYCFGNNCSPTTVYSSPLAIGNSKTLRYFARDSSGNTETIKTASYVIGLSCVENWTCSTWSACLNGNQTRSCVDQNACGTTVNKPLISQGCSATCSPNWSCANWSACNTLKTQTRICTDTNNCNITIGRPATNRSCSTACAPKWVCGDWAVCSRGKQKRVCTDGNNCGRTAGRPIITQFCTVTKTACAPNWVCDDWSACKVNKQTRQCADSNKCGVTAGKPASSQVCVASKLYSFLSGKLVRRAGNPAIYFVSSSNARYLFNNEKVFFSWFAGKWADQVVKVIRASDFNKLKVGHNVIIRPGTYLARFAPSPRTYAVLPKGELCWIKDIKTAVKLYSLNWHKKVVKLSSASFIDYVYSDCILSETSQHPDGTLIRYRGSNLTWYIDNGQKRLVSNAVFKTNKFRNEFVITNVSNEYVYPTGALFK